MSMDDALRLVAEGFKGFLPKNQQRVWAASPSHGFLWSWFHEGMHDFT